MIDDDPESTAEDHRRGPASDDPRVIRSLAITVDDVVTALEANRRHEAEAVLRVTPPFAPRMRARLHRVGGEGDYGEGPRPIHVAPSSLVTDTSPFPTPDETERALREDPDATYSPDRHRERHVAAVAEWRETVRDRLADRVALSLPDGDHEVTVKSLG